MNIAFLSWLLAQLFKGMHDFVVNKSVSFERIIGSGGMPSSHSAMVTALSIGMARVEGFHSSMFALTVAFAAVVMYDAMNVRRATGENTRALNRMVFRYNDIAESFESFKKRPLLDFDDNGDEDKKDDEQQAAGETPQEALKEYLGHTPLEVLAGALLGILIAMIYPL